MYKEQFPVREIEINEILKIEDDIIKLKRKPVNNDNIVNKKNVFSD